MTLTEANELVEEYNSLDEAFRSAKKYSDHKKAAKYKAQRDNIDQEQLAEAFRIRRESQARLNFGKF